MNIIRQYIYGLLIVVVAGCAKEVLKSPSKIETVGLKDLNIYYGDLHQHTTFSDGDVEIENNLKYIKENKVLDFVAISDHSQYFDHPEEWQKSETWKKIRAATDKYNENGVFIALPAFEWSKNSDTGSGGKGHINTFATSWWATANTDEMSVENYYRKLKDDPASISMFNHPASSSYNNFGFHDTEIDKRITVFEIATRSGRPTFRPRLQTYIHALDQGWHLAPADNTDTHKGFWWADHCFGRTAIIAKDLTRESLYEAMRNRRLYATYDRNLRMNFSVNNQLMGSILNKPSELKVLIELEDPDMDDRIIKVEIFTVGGEVVISKDFGSNMVKWELDLEPSKKYYFIKVTQADNDLAFSSPIWTGH